jgi:hypothetical protein
LFSKECQGIPARIIGGMIILIAIALPTEVYNSVAYLSVALADWLNIIILLATIVILKMKVDREETSHKWYSGAIIALTIIVAGLVGLMLYDGIVNYVETYRNRAVIIQDSIQCIFPIIVASIPGSLFIIIMMIGRRKRGLSLVTGVFGGVLSGAIAGSSPLLYFIRFKTEGDSIFVSPYFAIGFCAIISGITSFYQSAVLESSRLTRLRKELVYTESRIAQLEERLGNNDIVNKAPAEFVQKEREWLAAYKETAEKLKTQLKR